MVSSEAVGRTIGNLGREGGRPTKALEALGGRRREVSEVLSWGGGKRERLVGLGV